MPTLNKPVFVKPLNNLKVRKETSTFQTPDELAFLADTGEIVTHSIYWHRREQDGDVSLSDDLTLADLPVKKTTKPSNDLAAVASTETK